MKSQLHDFSAPDFIGQIDNKKFNEKGSKEALETLRVIPKFLISSTTGKMEPLILRECLYFPGVKKTRSSMNHTSSSSRRAWRDSSRCDHVREEHLK